MLSTNERFQKLEEAQGLLQEALDLVKEATKGHYVESNVKAYFTDHLRIMVDDNHGFLTNDLNIDKIKANIQDEDECFDEDE